MHPLHCALDVLWKWFFTPSGKSNLWFCCIHHEKTCFEVIFAKGCSEDAPKVLCGGVGSLLVRFGSALRAFWRASGSVPEASGSIWGPVGHVIGRFGGALEPLGRVFLLWNPSLKQYEIQYRFLIIFKSFGRRIFGYFWVENVGKLNEKLQA